MKRLFLICAALLVSGSAYAQVLDNPTDKLRITWPAPVVSADGLDAPSGIRVTAVNPTDTGVVVRTWDVAPTATSLELTTAQLPAGMFSVTVAPFNSFGVAGGTAPVGPFGKMTAPKSLGPATGAVIEAGSASLEKPASGVALSGLTPMSTLSTTRTLAVVSEQWCFSPTAGLVSSNSLSLQETPSDCVWQTFSRLQKLTLSPSTHASR